MFGMVTSGKAILNLVWPG